MELTTTNLMTASLENLRLAALLMNEDNTATKVNWYDRYGLWAYLEYAQDRIEMEERAPSMQEWEDKADAPEYEHRGDGVPAL